VSSRAGKNFDIWFMFLLLSTSAVLSLAMRFLVLPQLPGDAAHADLATVIERVSWNEEQERVVGLLQLENGIYRTALITLVRVMMPLNAVALVWMVVIVMRRRAVR
jgi:hypothetical protein